MGLAQFFHLGLGQRRGAGPAQQPQAGGFFQLFQHGHADVGQEVRLSGWINRTREHANVLFVDLRDHYGITQIVVETGSALFPVVDAAGPESVLTVTGKVFARSPETQNPKLPTGEIEIFPSAIVVQSSAERLPLPVFGDAEYPEDVRLKYRFLDLRRERLHANIMLRSQ
eukprot:gene39093-52823_t